MKKEEQFNLQINKKKNQSITRYENIFLKKREQI